MSFSVNDRLDIFLNNQKVGEFVVESIQEDGVYIHPLNQPQARSKLVSIDGQWKIFGAETQDYQIQNISSNPFLNVLPQIASLETQLNQVKDRLNVPEFEQRKNQSPWERAIRGLRNTVKREYSGEGVTKAWLKMYEMLNLKDVSEKLLSLPSVHGFFNAELPGGFILATNHWLANHQKDFQWMISSYYPREKEGKDFLPDTFELLQKHPSQSLVGFLNTSRGPFYSDGDLTNLKMPQILSTLASKKLGTIHLYTADGGIDVRGQENLQEKLSLKLVLGEVETGLRSLSPGGVFILKIFTFFTPEMLTLLSLLYSLFEKPSLYKPVTSGPLNSEVYFIGVGYKGASSDIIQRIHEGLEGNRTSFALPGEVSPKMKDELVKKLTNLSQKQINMIQQFMEGRPLDTSKLSGVISNIQPLPENRKLL